MIMNISFAIGKVEFEIFLDASAHIVIPPMNAIDPMCFRPLPSANVNWLLPIHVYVQH